MKNNLTIQIALDLSEVEQFFRSIIREEMATSNIQPTADEKMPVPAKDLINSRELADYLSVSTISIYRLRKEGRLGYYRVGSKVLFSIREHVMPYLATTGSTQLPRQRRLA